MVTHDWALSMQQIFLHIRKTKAENNFVTSCLYVRVPRHLFWCDPPTSICCTFKTFLFLNRIHPVYRVMPKLLSFLKWLRSHFLISMTSLNMATCIGKHVSLMSSLQSLYCRLSDSKVWIRLCNNLEIYPFNKASK